MSVGNPQHTITVVTSVKWQIIDLFLNRVRLRSHRDSSLQAQPLQKRLGKAGWAKQRGASVEQGPLAQPGDQMQFMEKAVQLLCLAQKLMIFEILKSAGKM